MNLLFLSLGVSGVLGRTGTIKFRDDFGQQVRNILRYDVEGEYVFKTSQKYGTYFEKTEGPQVWVYKYRNYWRVNLNKLNSKYL